jgi:hypothetical protein
MTTKSLLRLCAGLVGAAGIGLIINPDFVVLRSEGSLSVDSAVARATGFVLTVLCLRCWPNENDIDGRAIWALLTYAFLTTLYLGYLKVVAGFVSALLTPVLVIHAGMAILLAGLAYERRGSTANRGLANQH